MSPLKHRAALALKSSRTQLPVYPKRKIVPCQIFAETPLIPVTMITKQMNLKKKIWFKWLSPLNQRRLDRRRILKVLHPGLEMKTILSYERSRSVPAVVNKTKVNIQAAFPSSRMLLDQRPEVSIEIPLKIA